MGGGRPAGGGDGAHKEGGTQASSIQLPVYLLPFVFAPIFFRSNFYLVLFLAPILKPGATEKTGESYVNSAILKVWLLPDGICWQVLTVGVF